MALGDDEARAGGGAACPPRLGAAATGESEVLTGGIALATSSFGGSCGVMLELPAGRADRRGAPKSGDSLTGRTTGAARSAPIGPVNSSCACGPDTGCGTGPATTAGAPLLKVDERTSDAIVGERRVS